MLMSLESTSSRAERLARHLTIYDRIIPVEEISQRIDPVRQTISGALPAAVIVRADGDGDGPVDGLIDYETVKARLAG